MQIHINAAPGDWAQRLAEADKSARLMETNYRIVAQNFVRASLKAADFERQCIALRRRLATYEPEPVDPAEHPAIAAVAAMQRGGLR
jgi:hypothetical protein